MKKILKIMAAVFVMVLLCGMAVSANSTITPTQIRTGFEDTSTSTVYTYTYNQSSNFTLSGKEYIGGQTIPVSVSAPGILYFDFRQTQSLSTATTVMLLDSLNTGESYILADADRSATLENKFIKVKIERAGTYYLLMYTKSSYLSGLTANTINLRSYFLADDFSVTTKNKTIGLDPFTSNETVYIMYKAPYNGYVTITTQGSTGSVTLLKADKRTALSTQDSFNPSYSNRNRLTYGVKKGTVYYFRVQSYGKVALNFKSGQINEKSGSSKKKAVAVKKGKTVKGYIQAGSKTADWYKFTVTKTSKTRIYLNGGTNGRFKITVYRSNGNSMGSGSVKGTPCKTTFIFERLKKEIKLAKGTYYIKIERYNKNSSGYYTLKWK